jgi:hypothetical protein
MTKISIQGYEPAHLSHSTVSSLRLCGKKFQLTKVLRLEEKPGLAALGGNAVHYASEAVDALILEGGYAALSGEVDNVNEGDAQ